MIKGLQPLGFDKDMARDVYYAIVPPRHRQRGYLSKQDWANALSHTSDLAEVIISPGQTPTGSGHVTMFAPEASDAPTLARGNISPVLQSLHSHAPEFGAGPEADLSAYDVLTQFREIVLRRFGTVETAFQRIDRNASGQITLAELNKAFSGEPGFDREMANAVFAELLPRNSSSTQGTVSREDWSRAMRKRQSPRGASSSTLVRNSSSGADVLGIMSMETLGIRVLLVERYGDLKKSFEAFDANKTGQLSSIEFVAGLNRLHVDRA